MIHANEGVPCDVQFTSAATNDSFMLAPSHYKHDEIAAMDRAYINYDKFEELADRGVVYVTKMKKNLNYEALVDCMHQNPQGLMEYREQGDSQGYGYDSDCYKQHFHERKGRKFAYNKQGC